jgi:hypothetical protein
LAAFASRLLQPFKIEDADVPAAVVDKSRLLQRIGEHRAAGPAKAKPLDHKTPASATDHRRLADPGSAVARKTRLDRVGCVACGERTGRGYWRGETSADF